MKTIEEKAKAYDEAIERAKKMTSDLTNLQAIREFIFPELRESEDERMMREFNDWLCEEIECRTNDLRDEKDRRTLNMLCYVLTKVKEWLEKQKGNSLSLVDAWKEMRTEVFAQASGNKPKPESDDFTKSFSLNDIDFLISDLDSRGIKPKPVEKQDYSGLTDLERAIHRGFLCAGVENVPVTIIKETAQDCLAHIKPVELKYWGKEMVRSIISILERDNCFKVVDEKPMRIFAHEQEINYLRNLQEYLYPNPHWKPSEEQMNTIGLAIQVLNSSGHNSLCCKLNALRDDLLKLK